LADASAFGNGLRIAAAACWKAAAAFSSALGRGSMFVVGVPVWGLVISGMVGVDC
jgi:drug/metabolite transporter (DMT)-like permease